MKRVFSALCLFLFTACAFAEYTPVYARNGMVVTAEPAATLAGVETLKRGGNAFDAAVAVGFALTVTYPAAGNIGGGGFLVAAGADGEGLALDFRERAPLKAFRDLYLDSDGNVIKGLSTDTHLAVGVPGSVHGLLTVLADHGKLSRAAAIAPAIRLAEEGFPVTYGFSRWLDSERERLTQFPSTAKVFYVDGEAPAPGTILKQPDLAKTLRIIAEKGIDGFYRGSVAHTFVTHMQKNGGLITHEDLQTYRSQYRRPFAFDYKNYRLLTHPMPNSGGVTLAQILKLIEPLRLRDMGYQSAKYVQALVEAERLAYADRNYFLGDSDFVDVPSDALISDSYLAARRKLIPKGRAGKSQGVSHGQPESRQTTHYCVVDKDRNVVAVTTTLNGSFGMGAVVEGAGFFLNNEMDDFSAKPGVPNLYGLVGAEANAIEPGKRMLSSMTPTVVFKDGEFDFTIGTPGGATIITTNAQVFLNVTEFGMNVRDAIDRPRFHHQWLPDEIRVERFSLGPETRTQLEGMGYTLKERESIGNAAGIQVTEDGFLAGHADARGTGAAKGY